MNNHYMAQDIAADIHDMTCHLSRLGMKEVMDIVRQKRHDDIGNGKIVSEPHPAYEKAMKTLDKLKKKVAEMQAGTRFIPDVERKTL